MQKIPQVVGSSIETLSQPPRCSLDRIHLYGWDTRTGTWHGPNEFEPCDRPDRRMLRALRAVPGKSWYGPLACCSGDDPSARFFALVHDLSDCTVAMIYCDESKAGPAEIVAVLPASRLPQLRSDFAFEFLAFARFLGALTAESELEVHNAIESALAEERGAHTLVFSVSSGSWPSDLDHVLSHCVEKVATTLCQWMDDSAAPPQRNIHPGSIPAA